MHVELVEQQTLISNNHSKTITLRDSIIKQKNSYVKIYDVNIELQDIASIAIMNNRMTFVTAGYLSIQLLKLHTTNIPKLIVKFIAKSEIQLTPAVGEICLKLETTFLG